MRYKALAGQREKGTRFYYRAISCPAPDVAVPLPKLRSVEAKSPMGQEGASDMPLNDGQYRQRDKLSTLALLFSAAARVE
ncbi:MAG: hypothetical protein WAP52_04495 [Candidatus Sungiibacteriota bacterium]